MKCIERNIPTQYTQIQQAAVTIKSQSAYHSIVHQSVSYKTLLSIPIHLLFVLYFAILYFIPMISSPKTYRKKIHNIHI